MHAGATRALIRLEGVRKRFGAVKALDGVDFTVFKGEFIGLVGHNGAGKSTLMQIIAGTVAASSGTIMVGHRILDFHSVTRAHKIGIRCIFQELSLCPNLSVAENTRISHQILRGFGWRRRAGRLILDMLDEIFPGHDISPGDIVQDLSIGRRQMVEIARAFTVTDAPLHLVILDEPTSSLDGHTSEQLLAFLRRFVADGGSCIIISHMLGEILNNANRIVVMRDGQVVVSDEAKTFDRARLVAAMGSVEVHAPAENTTPVNEVSIGQLCARASPAEQIDGRAVVARQGEVIGLAGLAGHGQTELLLALYAGNRRYTSMTGRAAFVAGDRQTDGVFPQWSIAANITIGSLPALRSGPFISLPRERSFAMTWQKRIGIRTPDVDNSILSLSGGNQQKALFARALGSNADIILMDDPMRGVDLGTRIEVYSWIRDEAASGRTFIWYTTETEELENCHRIYVFHNRRIVAEFDRAELTEERIIRSSFSEAG